MEKDWLEEVKDLRAARDSQYAVARPKSDAVTRLMALRSDLGLTQTEVARRMGVPVARVNEIEKRSDKVSLDRIHAYAAALGARFDLVLPDTPEELLCAQTGSPAIDVKAVGVKLRELAALLEPLTPAKS